MTEETSSPLWSIAENLPQVGSDIAKVRTLVSVASDLSANVVTPAAQNLSGVSMGTVFSNGKIDIATLQTICNTISQIQPAIAASAVRVDALGTPQLEQLKEPLAKAKTMLDSLNEAATGLVRDHPDASCDAGCQWYVELSCDRVEQLRDPLHWRLPGLQDAHDHRQRADRARKL